MNLLNIAITEAGGVAELAKSLGVVPSAVGNWKSRGIPRAWQLALELRYKKSISCAKSKAAAEKNNTGVRV